MSSLMTHAAQSILVRLVTVGVFVSVSGLLLTFSAAAQSRKAPTAHTARKSHAAPAVKKGARAIAINAEEMQSLLKAMAITRCW